MKEIIPKLPKEEKYDLCDQMRRACKAPVAIIAEGYARKNYKKDWQKYITDAIGECNEMIVHLSSSRDLYPDYIPRKLADKLIDEYNISGKQLYRLGKVGRINHKTSHPHPHPRLTTHNSLLIQCAINRSVNSIKWNGAGDYQYRADHGPSAFLRGGGGAPADEPEFCPAKVGTKFARRAAGQNLGEILRYRRGNPGILRARICV